MIFFSLTILSGGSLGWTAPENNQGGFEGVVSGESGQKIPAVEITFVKEDGSVVERVTTDEDGNYSISLGEVRYWVRATHPDYEDYSSFPEFLEVTDDGYQTLDIVLRVPRVTTVLLVRHAEKAYDPQNPDDPDLSLAGWGRAKKLAYVARKAGVTAIYATPAKRTQQTVQPLADFFLKLDIIDEDYRPGRQILLNHEGDVVLVANHSMGEIRGIIDQLGGNSCNGQVEYHEFDNLFVVTCGPSDTNVVNLQYGVSNTPEHPVVCTNQMATILLVRYAEPDNNSLSQAGRLRVEKLAHVVRKAGVDSIYASEDIPTQETAQHLVDELEEIKEANSYDSDKVQEFVDHVLLSEQLKGKTVVVAGENDTLSEIINELGGSPIPSLFEDEYDNLFVVTVYEPSELHGICQNSSPELHRFDGNR
jgi:broad specificity phosphatase PhoE